MREIKFRAWSKESKVMMMDAQNMYDCLGTWYDNHGNKIDPYNGFHVSSFKNILEDENCVVMQFTGIKDKNGKEIYEGDIVRDHSLDMWSDPNVIYEVKWRTFADQDYPLRYFGYMFSSITDGLEVIGNIYENPELLSPNEGSAQTMPK